ncbi:MAG: carbon storage regulator [Candidatus Scalindua sp.]
MLVLARRQGESLIIADDIKITVLIIYKAKIKMGVNSEVVTVKLRESISIGDGITIRLIKMDTNQVKLGIEAPEDVSIKREEVYLKDQVGNV